LKIKIKKINDSATIPSYAKHGDAGMDITATSRTLDRNFVEYGTGLSIEIPEGFLGLIFPRSSISKLNLSLTNSVGVIDAGFRGEIKIRFDRRDHDAIIKDYVIGERVAQIVIMPFPKIEFEESSELSETVRGAGGFGSTNTPDYQNPYRNIESEVKLKYKNNSRKGKEL